MSKFIILGSGPCGLATAYGFAKKGMNVKSIGLEIELEAWVEVKKLMEWFLIMVHIFIIHMTKK